MPDAKVNDATLATRRRAELRGLEAEGRSQVNVGVWTMRLFAVSNCLTGIVGLFQGDIRSSATGFIVGSGLITASLRLERGKRAEVVVIGAMFALSRWDRF